MPVSSPLGPLDRQLHPLHSSLDTRQVSQRAAAPAPFSDQASASMQRVPTEWGAVCPPPAGLCLRVGGRAGSRTHVGLAAPREASGQGQDLSPGVLPVSLSHHKQKGTLVAGRPGGVQRWRRSRGSEKEPMRSEAQADSPRPLACPLDLSPLEWPDCDQAHLLRQQKEPDSRGPACTPQPGQAPVSGSP